MLGQSNKGNGEDTFQKENGLDRGNNTILNKLKKR